ncbi:MAG TPA: glycerol-3-phosphate dehydrogenase, partial [Trueperaceae bacterium]|nr:glycerol-3-phosphate dehydrogenase [Trueperaceae bacterium]
EVSAKGLVTITGGKWTTYRLMARDALDRAVATAGLNAAGPSRTADLSLVGANGYSPQLAGQLAERFGTQKEIEPGLM